MNETVAAALSGKSITSATSSLTKLAIGLDNGDGLVLTAQESGITAVVLDQSKLPQDQDAVCKVDWSWILESRIKSVAITAQRVNFVLEPAGPLSVSLQSWQGSPFLAFQPYKAPGK